MLTSILKLKKFSDKLNADHITAFSSQATFFIILSFFPFLMFFLTLTQYLPFTQEDLTNLLLNIVPKDIHTYIVAIIDDTYKKTSGTLFSVSIISTLWSASKGILAITHGFNSIYQTNETRNFIILRIISMFYTFIFSIIIILILIFLVFGNRLYSFIYELSPFLNNIANKIIEFRGITSIFLLLFFFTLIYRVFPNKKLCIKNAIPGACFSSIGWYLLSYLFSFYIDNFSNFSYMYGSLTSIIVTLLWLYICMNILFIGAEINYFIQYDFKPKKHKEI